MGTHDRRSFLLGACASLGGLLLPRPARSAPSASRVAVVRDGSVWTGAGWGDADLDPAGCERMIRRALTELTGELSASRALGSLIPAVADPGQRYGIKVNCVNDDLPSHPQVVMALVRLLVEAGARPERVIIFDRLDAELVQGGYRIQDEGGPLVFGSDHAGVGYDDSTLEIDGANIRVSRILTSRIDHLINVPVLKHHEMTGLTASLKNHFGSIDQPMLLHGSDRDCCPGIPRLAAIPAIRERTRLVLVDATFSSYRSGLGGRPDFAPMSVIAASDPVAADAVGLELVNERRASDGLSRLEVRHITEAAAAGLGYADGASIDRRDVELQPVEEKTKPWERTGAREGCNTSGGFRPGAELLTGLAAAAVARFRRRLSRAQRVKKI